MKVPCRSKRHEPPLVAPKRLLGDMSGFMSRSTTRNLAHGGKTGFQQNLGMSNHELPGSFEPACI
jgi:hypothetical protein